MYLPGFRHKRNTLVFILAIPDQNIKVWIIRIDLIYLHKWLNIQFIEMNNIIFPKYTSQSNGMWWTLETALNNYYDKNYHWCGIKTKQWIFLLGFIIILNGSKLLYEIPHINHAFELSQNFNGYSVHGTWNVQIGIRSLSYHISIRIEFGH